MKQLKKSGASKSISQFPPRISVGLGDLGVSLWCPAYCVELSPADVWEGGSGGTNPAFFTGEFTEIARSDMHVARQGMHGISCLS